jgi:hypothetical protein
MKRWLAMSGLLVAGLLVADVATARADRVPMTRSSGQSSTGARRDISVPYLTTGNTAFGAYSVAPRVYASPIMDDPAHPQAKPVYNLPFYGAVQSFGSQSEGATPGPSRTLRPK